ncbi:MAG: hypothetical protein WB588_07705 [Dehalococcoidia bacterium]
MSSSNRFLLGFGILILVIVAAAVVIAVIGSNQPVKVLPENTPEGTVQRFLTAIKDQDYTVAEALVAPPSETDKYNDLDQWVKSRQSAGSTNSSWKASIVKSTVKGDSATVQVAADVFRPGGLLSDPVSTSQVTFSLHKSGDAWLIDQPVDLWWLY